jgi:hypothetical protein
MTHKNNIQAMPVEPYILQEIEKPGIACLNIRFGWHCYLLH